MQKALQDSRDAAMKEQDKEARRNNIILYTVPESDAPMAADHHLLVVNIWLTRDFANSSY